MPIFHWLEDKESFMGNWKHSWLKFLGETNWILIRQFLAFNFREVGGGSEVSGAMCLRSSVNDSIKH